MARRTKDAPTGRVTPKGGGLSRTPRVDAAERGRPASGRYTAPIPHEFQESSRFVPILMLAFFAIGIIGIMLNYLGVLPGGAKNSYLLIGLGLIVLGFITSTRWR